MVCAERAGVPNRTGNDAHELSGATRPHDPASPAVNPHQANNAPPTSMTSSAKSHLTSLKLDIKRFNV